MQIYKSYFKTLNGLTINISEDIVESEISSYSVNGSSQIQYVCTRVDNSYHLSRLLRTISVFLCFFLLDNPWLSIPISLACFAIGYLYMLVCDYFPFSILVDLFGMIYGILFRFLIVPISVLIVSVITKQYLFIFIYLLSVIVSFVYRFVFDSIYIKHFKRLYGITYTPVDSKVSHILYRFSNHRIYNNYRSYSNYLISRMSFE